MIFHRKFAVSLLDLALVGGPGDAQLGVKVSPLLVGHHFALNDFNNVLVKLDL
jgi:hypothetical protein